MIKELLDLAGKDKKKTQRAKNAKKLAVGVGAAATVGVAAGILLAPKAGKETREDIKNKAEEVIDNTKEIVHKNVEHVKESTSHAAHEISDVIKDAHVKKDAVKKDIKEGHDKVAHDIDKAAKKISEELKKTDK